MLLEFRKKLYLKNYNFPDNELYLLHLYVITVSFDPLVNYRFNSTSTEIIKLYLPTSFLNKIYLANSWFSQNNQHISSCFLPSLKNDFFFLLNFVMYRFIQLKSVLSNSSLFVKKPNQTKTRNLC